MGTDKPQHTTKSNKPQINKEATLARFTAASIRVSGWCRSRGIERGRFYSVINNKSFKRRDCFKGREVIEALRADGLLVEDNVG